MVGFRRSGHIWRFLHFVDNNSATVPSGSVANGTLSSVAANGTFSSGAAYGTLSSRPADRLWKLRPVIEAVVAACRTNYQPHRENSIDEVMVAFKGRSSMKQYIPLKPVKRGLKVWVHADSHNGYVFEFECYTGKKGDTAEIRSGGLVVKRLTRDLVGKYYHVYMDNFFSSVILYKDLLNDGIYCTGTLQTNRKYFPLDLLAYTKGLAKRGDMMTRQEGNLTVTVWQDKRVVISMSTGHNPDQTKVVKRKKVDGSVIHVDCPESIVDYNKFMGGVDKGDQIRKYHVKVKSCKAYKYIFWFVFDVCVQKHMFFVNTIRDNALTPKRIYDSGKS